MQLLHFRGNKEVITIDEFYRISDNITINVIHLIKQ